MADRGHDADPPEERVGEAPLELREVVEVHAVHARQERERDEDGADDREHLHDLVHPVAHRGHVGLGEPPRHLAVGLDDVDRLHRVVVDVAHVGARHVREALVRLALHLREHLAHRPERAPHQQQLALGAVDLLDHLGARALQHQVLEQLETVAEVLEDREGLVHDRVDQRVAEEARVVHPQLRARRADALADRVPDVARRLLEREHRAVADEDAHLLGVQLPLAQLQLARDDEEPRLVGAVVLVGLHLGTLRHVQHVLERERVQAILLGERAHHAQVREAVDVDPAHRRPVLAVARDERGQVLDLLEHRLLRRVVDAAHPHRRALRRDRRQVLRLDARGRAGRLALEAPRQAQAALALRRALARPREGGRARRSAGRGRPGACGPVRGEDHVERAVRGALRGSGGWRGLGGSRARRRVDRDVRAVGLAHPSQSYARPAGGSTPPR